MRDLPAVEVSWRDVPGEDHDLACQAVYWGWKHAGIPEPAGKIPRRETFLVRWFEPDGKMLGMFDESKNHIWLSTELLGNPEEIARTTCHEVAHAKQFAEGHLFSEAGAVVTGEWLLKAWTQRTAELEAKAAARRVIVRPAPVRPHRMDHPCAYLELPSDPPVHPTWSFDHTIRRRD